VPFCSAKLNGFIRSVDFYVCVEYNGIGYFFYFFQRKIEQLPRFSSEESPDTLLF